MAVLMQPGPREVGVRLNSCLPFLAGKMYPRAYNGWYIKVLQFFSMYPAMGVALYRRGVMDNLAR